MAKTQMKFSGKIEGTERKLFLNVMEPEEGKSGLPAFLNEVNAGNKLPGHRVTLFVNGNDENKWLTVSAPLRKANEDGSFVTQPRVNTDGQFMNDKGEVVEKAEDAAPQFEYLKFDENGEERIVYGTIASINIKNEKVDGTPTAYTLGNTKFYDDADALEIARLTYELKQLDEGSEERKAIEEELSTMRRERGVWTTLFIDKGHEKLREMGFEIRAKEPEGPTPN